MSFFQSVEFLTEGKHAHHVCWRILETDCSLWQESKNKKFCDESENFKNDLLSKQSLFKSIC